MNPVDPELLSLTEELAQLGGSRKVKLSRISVLIRGINHVSSPDNVNFISFIDENNQIIIRHPSSANDMRCYSISNYFGPTVPNERVSADIVNKITTSMFDGFNVNLITYGATKTGKSQLLFGPASANMQYDSCDGLFGTLSANILRKIDQTDDSISLAMSAWEIDANSVTDLLRNDTNHTIQSPFDITSVSLSNWDEICSVWDIARYNSANWKTLNTGYEILPNQSNVFIQIKIYNQTQQRVTTLNLIDLAGSHHTARPLRAHISRDTIEQNKAKNVNIFSLNKLLHHLSNIHLKNGENGANKSCKNDLIQNVITESLLNNFIGPMITQNAETIFLGTVSCNALDYQASLRTIQVLSHTLHIKVPCIHTPFGSLHQNKPSSVVTFTQFVSQFQSILYKHMMIEDSIRQQMRRYDQCQDANNMTQVIDDACDELVNQSLEDQLEELRKNIPQNTLQSNTKTDESSAQIKQEISLLLDDILEPKPHESTTVKDRAPNHISTQHDLFLESHDLEAMLKSTTSIKQQESDEFKLSSTEDCSDEKEEDKTVAHLDFANLRLENCKLKEEMRKLKAQSKYSSVFEDYDREIGTLHKLLQAMADDNKALTIKNLKLLDHVHNYKLNGDKCNQVKTVRILQKSVRQTTKKLKERDASLMKLTSHIRRSNIRNRVLQTSKDEWYQMSQLLNQREKELGKSYLDQAETQAKVDKLQLQITELQHENNTLTMHTDSLENEVCTLRSICKRVNDDMKQRNQLHRVSKKWAPKR
eukprot:497536_1